MQIYITEHARKRMKQRYITHDDIVSVLTNANPKPTRDELEYTYNDIVVITNNHDGKIIVVVTAHYTSKFNRQCEKLAKKLKISFRQAIKIIRNIT